MLAFPHQKRKYYICTYMISDHPSVHPVHSILHPAADIAHRFTPEQASLLRHRILNFSYASCPKSLLVNAPLET